MNIFDGIDLGPGATRQAGNDNRLDDNMRDSVAAMVTACAADCNRQGDCIDEKCECYEGYEGELCADEAQPGLSASSIAVIVLMILVALLVVGVIVYATRSMAVKENDGFQVIFLSFSFFFFKKK